MHDEAVSELEEVRSTAGQAARLNPTQKGKRPSSAAIAIESAPDGCRRQPRRGPLSNCWSGPSPANGGEGGIRTPDSRGHRYNGFRVRRIQPLCHLSARRGPFTRAGRPRTRSLARARVLPLTLCPRAPPPLFFFFFFFFSARDLKSLSTAGVSPRRRARLRA